jgi:amidase
MSFAEYSNYDGLALADLVNKKEVKPSELVEAAIDRIERHNPRLNPSCSKLMTKRAQERPRSFRVPLLACRHC